MSPYKAAPVHNERMEVVWYGVDGPGGIALKFMVPQAADNVATMLNVAYAEGRKSAEPVEKLRKAAERRATAP